MNKEKICKMFAIDTDDESIIARNIIDGKISLEFFAIDNDKVYQHLYIVSKVSSIQQAEWYIVVDENENPVSIPLKGYSSDLSRNFVRKVHASTNSLLHNSDDNDENFPVLPIQSTTIEDFIKFHNESGSNVKDVKCLFQMFNLSDAILPEAEWENFDTVLRDDQVHFPTFTYDEVVEILKTYTLDIHNRLHLNNYPEFWAKKNLL